MNRRSFMATATLAPLAASTQVNATAIDPDVIDKPFLHVLRGPIEGHWSNSVAGDWVLVVPAAVVDEETYLLRDGQFAGVQLDWGDNGTNHYHVYGGENFFAPVEDASKIVVGRVARFMRLREGQWYSDRGHR